MERKSATSGWTDFRDPFGSGIAYPAAPFGRLALTHALAAAGDTVVAIALAKTLFFVSPNEARGKVLLYLLVTLAPFAVISPFVGPLIDRFADRRKTIVVGALGARCLVCLLLIRDYDNWALFPETFALLVLSKGYAVARNAVIPSVVTRSSELVRANSKLALVAGLAGFTAAIPGGLLSLGGPGWVALLGSVVFGVAAFTATQLIIADVPFAGDAIAERAESSELSHRARPQTPRSRSKDPFRSESVQRIASPLTTLRLATLVMSAQRLLIGLITFLVAFTFKREAAPTWWLGVIGALGVLGGLVGSAIAPRMRSRIPEQAMLTGGLACCAVFCLVASMQASKVAAGIVAFVVTFSANVGRLAFDSLVQREGGADQGSVFARSETRFQLAWVLGALFPVALEVSRSIGFLVMAVLSASMVVVYAGGERSLQRIDGTIDAGRSRWRRPARPHDDEWLVDDRDLP